MRELTPIEVEELRGRVGRTHLRRRLGLEEDHEVFVFSRRGAHFFYPENWYSVHGVIRSCLRVSGLYGRAQRNACAIGIRHNRLAIAGLPAPFSGFRLLHLSDLHVDMDRRNTAALASLIGELDYDLCVLTGDYRARTFGPYEPTLEGMAVIRERLKGEIFAILGNHDSIRMVPGLEAMGIRVLLNESVELERGGGSIYMAGIDDAHYYQVHNIDKASAAIPEEAVALLLSHTPEVYQHAAHSAFDVMLCGHTHGGQICLPGRIPVTLDSKCPRYMGAGAWTYRGMHGYTSAGAGTCIVPVRLNCPPEITVHRLRSA